MKVLHAAYTSNPTRGIARQMEFEQEAANSIGLDWTARLFAPKHFTGPICVAPESKTKSHLQYKLSYYSWLRQAMQNHDVLIQRYVMADPFLLKFLATFKKPTVLVHHTLEGPQLASGTDLRSRIKTVLDNALLKWCYRAADGMVCVTSEIERYEFERGAETDFSVLYPNGIMYPDNWQESLTKTPALSGVPQLLFVASEFVDWHGLDRLIQTVAEHPTIDCKIHIVGGTTQIQKQQLSKDARFVCHGQLAVSEVAGLAKECTVGLGSFALDRKAMFEACTLKVREYLGSGLPVYAGHRDVFDDQFPWFHEGPCNLKNIEQFAIQCNGVDRLSVARDAKPYIDKADLLTEFANALSGKFSTV